MLAVGAFKGSPVFTPSIYAGPVLPPLALQRQQSNFQLMFRNGTYFFVLSGIKEEKERKKMNLFYQVGKNK